jgi:hypothetical protein
MARASACLEATVDQFLDVFVTHDGSWRSMIGKGTYRLFVTDPAAGQVAFIGTLREENQQNKDGAAVLIALCRTRIARRRRTCISPACSRTTAKASILVLRPHRGPDDAADLVARRDVQAGAGKDSPDRSDSGALALRHALRLEQLGGRDVRPRARRNGKTVAPPFQSVGCTLTALALAPYLP